MGFMPRIVHVGGAALLTVLAGCDTLISVDFESDPIGAPPLASPPGPPQEMVEVFTPLGLEDEVPGTLIEVDLSPTGGRALTVRGDGIGREAVAVTSDTVTRSDARIVSTWTQSFTGPGEMVIALSIDGVDLSTAFDNACFIRVGQGEISMSCARTGQDATVVRDIDTTRPHQVTVTFLRQLDRTLIGVTQDGFTRSAEPPEFDNTVLLEPGQRMSMTFQFEGGLTSTYRLEELVVTELPQS